MPRFTLFDCCRTPQLDDAELFQRTFQYAEINSRTRIRAHNYTIASNSDFIQLDIIRGGQAASALTRVGWKLHISLNDDDNRFASLPSNLSRAWGLVILPIIWQYQLSSVKIVRMNETMRDADRGKQVTIYIYLDQRSTEDWRQISQHLTQELANHQIIPGELAKFDRSIPGSNYLSYRNDDDGTGDYQDTIALGAFDEAMRFNPHGFEDPLRDIVVHVEGQPQRTSPAAIALGSERSFEL